MYIETVPNRNSPPCILLRESFRDQGKVKHRTLANLTDWPRPILAGLRLLLKGHPPSATLSSESFRITRSLPHGHVEAVLRVVRTLGLDRLLGSKLSPERNLALAMMVARLLDPGSKLATARSLDSQTLSSTLAQECHLEGSIHENELYAAMDWLVSRQARIENALAARHLEWHMRKALAPMLFADEDPRLPREDVVSPKQPSPRAARKAQTKKTLDGTPVHSFQTLLADLSTIVRNSITPNLEGAPAWQQETEPSALQQKGV